MKRFMPLATALGIVVAVPSIASATTILDVRPCAGSTLQTCVDFTLTEDIEIAGKYYFTVKYFSSLATDPGVLTRVGLYDLKGVPDWDISDVELLSIPDGLKWSYGQNNSDCKGLSGGDAQAPWFEACATAGDPDETPAQPVKNGLQVGQSIQFSFKAAPAILESSFWVDNGLGGRVHIQSFGPEDCSFKIDTRVQADGTNQVSGPSQFNNDIDQCGPPKTTVPEPMTMLLLGSGLFGIGGVAIRRRRRELDIETEDTQI